MSEHRIAFFIEYIPFLHAILPAIQEVARNNISFDVIVPPLHQNTGDFIKNGRDDLLKTIEKLGVSVVDNYKKNNKYKIAYSAYHGNHEELARINKIDYNVRFQYAIMVGQKPDMIGLKYFYFYDFLLCLSVPDVELNSGFIKPHLVGNIKLANYKRLRLSPSDKKTILYLPTWGSGGEATTSINSATIGKLVELQKKYHIATKLHGHTVYSKKQQELRKLFNVFDKVYDVNNPVPDILDEADIVLSDLSSAAFDAIAGDVPLALFGLGEPIYYGGKLCLHQQLVKDDIIPGTNDVSELESVIEKALTPEYFAKQQTLKKEMFPFEGQECLNTFMQFQDDLFNDRVDPWYIATRKFIRDEYQKDVAQAYKAVIQETINAYENSTSWKVTRPLRAIGKLFNKQ